MLFLPDSLLLNRVDVLVLASRPKTCRVHHHHRVPTDVQRGFKNIPGKDFKLKLIVYQTCTHGAALSASIALLFQIISAKQLP